MKKSLVELQTISSEYKEKFRNIQLAFIDYNKEIPIEEVDSVKLNLNSKADDLFSFLVEHKDFFLENKSTSPDLIEAETIEKKLIEEKEQFAFLGSILNPGMEMCYSEETEIKNYGLLLCKYAAKGGLIRASKFLAHNSNDYEYSNMVIEQTDFIIEYNKLVNKKNNLKTDEFYQKLKILADGNSMYALNEIESRFIEITEENKQQAFKWFTELDEANYTHGTYSLAYMYSAGFVEDESKESVRLNPYDGSIIESTKRKNINEKYYLKKAIELFVRRNEMSLRVGHEPFNHGLLWSIANWLENIEEQSALHLTALGQIFLYFSKIECGFTKKAYLETCFTYFYKAGKMPEQFELGRYYSALLSLDNSIHINDEEKILINEWMESWTNQTLHVDDTELDKSSFSFIIINYIIFYANTFSLRKNKKELEEKNKALEASQGRMQKLVEQFTHSLGNVIFPDTIYQVAERLKKNPECRKDVLLLHEAYHSEIIIKLQGELLRQRYGNTNPEKFRQFIRSCRRTPNVSENTKSIEDILDYAASRVTARFLNQHYAGLNSIRDKILSKKNVSLNDLKQQFEDDILLNKSLRPIAWINQNLRTVKITEISPLWKKVFILSESHAEALLFGYFSEILFNAFKYADHDKDEFLTLVFDEKTINDITYLSCSWENPVKDKAPSMLGSGKGLDAIQEDLKQLNDTKNPEESLVISQQKNQFQATLFFKKDLLVNELPSLKIKRRANVE